MTTLSRQLLTKAAISWFTGLGCHWLTSHNSQLMHNTRIQISINNFTNLSIYSTRPKLVIFYKEQNLNLKSQGVWLHYYALNNTWRPVAAQDLVLKLFHQLTQNPPLYIALLPTDISWAWSLKPGNIVVLEWWTGKWWCGTVLVNNY